MTVAEWFSLPPERVRYAETDAMGVAHHATYLIWFEAARVELMRHVGHDYRSVEEEGYSMPVVEAQCRYRRPLRFDDAFVTQVRVTGGTKFRALFSYRIHLDAVLVAEGKTMHACIDRSGKLREIPWREWFGIDAPGLP
jgi:acyl-CoA thioester hydrolase